MASESEIVNADQIGALLGVTGRCVRNWDLEGLLPPPLVRNPRRWKLSKIVPWLATGRKLLAERLARRGGHRPKKSATA